MLTIFIAIFLYVVLTLIYKYNLTDKPNYFIGYRTPKSLKSEKHWKFAQKYSTELIQKLSIILLIIGIIQLIVEVTIGYIDQSAFASIILLFITIIILFIKTESELRKIK
ncbi:SdpI family protein [Macrococcus capreoli]|uniref:SdpI family protein n=1 Tax=Macrococcus capreoli TaxID=2982690 RepID=UPI003EE73CA5